MSALAPVAAAKAMPAVEFRAWRVAADNAPRHEAYPVEVPAHIETAEAAAQFACLHRGEMVMVLRSDAAERPERRHLLHIYQVKAKSNPQRRWDTALAKFVSAPPEYPALIGMVCVGEGFSPSQPWKWSPDADAVGADLTLVSQ